MTVRGSGPPVDTLIVGELGDATLVTGEELTTVAPNADALSELGEAPVLVKGR